ncbi:hypothetical protein C0992_002786, partial [Termitomyces sp. T32_za158]
TDSGKKRPILQTNSDSGKRRRLKEQSHKNRSTKRHAQRQQAGYGVHTSRPRVDEKYLKTYAKCGIQTALDIEKASAATTGLVGKRHTFQKDSTTLEELVESTNFWVISWDGR